MLNVMHISYALFKIMFCFCMLNVIMQAELRLASSNLKRCFAGGRQCGVLPGSDTHWHCGLQEQEQSWQLLLVRLSFGVSAPLFCGFLLYTWLSVWLGMKTWLSVWLGMKHPSYFLNDLVSSVEFSCICFGFSFCFSFFVFVLKEDCWVCLQSLACVLEGLKCWGAWDTTCRHKAKNITPSRLE